MQRTGGELFLEIEKDAIMVEKTPEEIDEEKRYVEAWMESMRVNGVVIEWDTEPYRYMISQIQADDTGRIRIPTLKKNLRICYHIVNALRTNITCGNSIQE